MFSCLIKNKDNELDEQDQVLEDELEDLDKKSKKPLQERAKIFLKTKQGRVVIVFCGIFVLFVFAKLLFPSKNRFDANKFKNKPAKSANVSPINTPVSEQKPSTEIPKIETPPVQPIPDIHPTQLEAPSLPDLPPVTLDDLKPSDNKLPTLPENALPLPPPPATDAASKDIINEMLEPAKKKSKRPERLDSKENLPSVVQTFSNSSSSSTAALSEQDKPEFIFVNSDIAIDEEAEPVKSKRLTNMSNTIAQGRIVEAVLETAINSQIPGTVRAIIAKDVYGELTNDILIPKGSRLYGSYKNITSRSLNRIAIVWSRILRPDGVSVTLSADAIDQFGRAGVEGDVDKKYLEVFEQLTLTTLLTLGVATGMTQLLGSNSFSQQTNFQNPQGVTNQIFSNPIAPAVQNSLNLISKTAQDVINDSLNATPVITVNQGTRINVMVNQDFTVPRFSKVQSDASSIRS